MGTPTTDHAHELCVEVHTSGPFADGTPHCVECGQVAPAEVLEAVAALAAFDLMAQVVAEAIVADEAAKALKARGLLREVLVCYEGLTIPELDELIGPEMSGILMEARLAGLDRPPRV